MSLYAITVLYDTLNMKKEELKQLNINKTLHI